MKTKLKGMMFGVVAGFTCTVIVGMMVNRNLALEGTYTYLKLFNEVLSLVRNSYVDEVETRSLVRGAWEGMIEEMDPASEYLTAEEYAAYTAFRERARRNPGLADTGIRVARKAGMLLVVSVKPGSSAAASGITPGDRVRRIGERIAGAISLAEAESLLSGAGGSKVFVSVARRTEPRKIETELEMTKTPLPDPTFEIVDRDAGLGVIRIPHFESGMSTQISRELSRASKGGIRKLLVDLRGNAWGSMDEAVSASSLFVGSGVVARLLGRDGEERELRAESGAPIWSGRLVMLIDLSTSGPAELFAAALRDHPATGGVVVGETSFGSGAEQEMMALKDGGWLKLSVRKYLSPDGTAWHGKGLVPSTTMIVSQDNLSWSERQQKQLDQAIDHLRKLTADAGRNESDAARLEAHPPGETAG